MYLSLMSEENQQKLEIVKGSQQNKSHQTKRGGLKTSLPRDSLHGISIVFMHQLDAEIFIGRCLSELEMRIDNTESGI